MSEYLFSWNKVPGEDNGRLLKHLLNDHGIDWAESAEIRKSDDGMTIYILKDEDSVELTIDEELEKATLKINYNYDRTHDLKIKKEYGKRNIYLDDGGEETKIKEEMITKEMIDFDVNLDSDLIIAMAQVPVKWKWKGNFVEHRNPGDQWKLIKQTLEEIKDTRFDGRTVDIAVFPEWAIPHEYAEEPIKGLIEEFNSDFILLAGFDFASLEEFVKLLEGSDNTRKVEQIALIRDRSSDYAHIKEKKPVNFCSIIVKSGETVKQYFQSKLFPSVYEQTGSRHSQILQGNYLLHFETKAEGGNKKSMLQKFSFMPLICFDHLYEKTEAGSSIIEQLIAFGEENEAPGFIFILQYNPRMDHEIIDDPLYEYYLCLPTRSLRALTYTLFTNVSEESGFEESEATTPVYGSLIVFNKKARFNNTSEHKLTKMGRGNLHKLKFVETSNRLYFLKCAILFNYEEQVRSSRNPIEIMQTMEYDDNQWKYLLPEKAAEPTELVLANILDRYCSDELIERFDKGDLGSNAVTVELSNNEILIVLRRGYENVRKEQIPKQLAEKIEQLNERLDKLECVIYKKGDGQNGLYNMESHITRSKELIKHITKRWKND